MESAFVKACIKGNFRLAQWIYSKNNNIDISNQNDYVFRRACFYNNCEFVKWLLSIKPNLDITTNNHEGFVIACSNDNLEVAQLLANMNDNYYLEIKDNTITKYRTNNSLHRALKIITESNDYNEALNILNCQNYGDSSLIKDNFCAICQDILVKPVVTPCIHTYCLNCILQWLVISDKDCAKCAYCRYKFSFRECSIIEE